MADAIQEQSRLAAEFSDDAAGMARGVVDNLTQTGEQRNVVTSLGERCSIRPMNDVSGWKMVDCCPWQIR